MSTDNAVLEAELAATKAALTAKLTGGMVTEVDYDGHSTKFAQTSEVALRRRIRELQRQLGISTSGPGSRRVSF